MFIHFIAIGGAAMHSLAITLQRKGYLITGSDDEIVDPARSALATAGLLPEKAGWFPEKIHTGLDGIILGMHAHPDNPELKKALELGLKVYSYPEFLYHETAGKTRVVIAGSHGKTTITSMIMHALRYNGYRFDYMAGSGLAGFNNMVNLEEENNIAVFEGDEYLASCIDRRPKFHLYQPQIALVSGIAWDHMNVFPTWEDYVEQFRLFIRAMPLDGSLVYCYEDMELTDIVEQTCSAANKVPYKTPSYEIANGVCRVVHQGTTYPMEIFGRHNMQNLEGARMICAELGMEASSFYRAITTFKGAGRRLQKMGEKDGSIVYFDFAHSPSKVQATVNAVREQFPGKRVVACLELHTYSSLNKEFLVQYRGSLREADVPVVYYNPETVRHKRLAPIQTEEVFRAFDTTGLTVFTDRDKLEEYLTGNSRINTVWLLMSSGNFSGTNLEMLTKTLLNKSDL